MYVTASKINCMPAGSTYDFCINFSDRPIFVISRSTKGYRIAQLLLIYLSVSSSFNIVVSYGKWNTALYLTLCPVEHVKNCVPYHVPPSKNMLKILYLVLYLVKYVETCAYLVVISFHRDKLGALMHPYTQSCWHLCSLTRRYFSINGFTWVYTLTSRLCEELRLFIELLF